MPTPPAPDPICTTHPPEAPDDGCLDCAIDAALSVAPPDVNLIGLGTWIPPEHWDGYLSWVAGVDGAAVDGGPSPAG